MKRFSKGFVPRWLQAGLLFVALIVVMGAGEDARFNRLGHEMMCMCGCNQILLECNHVGCQYSDRMRGELMAALDRGDNDSLALQSFVQKYGTTVIAAPSSEGFGRVAWIMPYFALVVGIGVVVMVIRTWKNRPLVVPAGTPVPVTGPELDRYRDQARKDTEL